MKTTVLSLATLRYSAEKGKGHATFDGALKALSENGKLNGVNGFELFSDQRIEPVCVA